MRRGEGLGIGLTLTLTLSFPRCDLEALLPHQQVR
jgi:hypothetical protein